MTITAAQAPLLARVPNVELMHTGTWNLSTGEVTFTPEDLSSAVAALGCPAVRRPVLKLGHDSAMPIGDGEPAVGWVDNLATAENGRTLVGDYAGMPGWMGGVIASAFPDRSIEGEFGYQCQLGHTHPFVVHAVALLGVTAPGIGTLQSLQDVAALYGVAATAEPATGTPVTVHASGGPVPNPTPQLIAAATSAEDVSRAFYQSPLGSGWDSWIEEIQLDPMQLIVVNDVDGTRSRIPITVGAGDGSDGVTFGDPVPVVITYIDAPASKTEAAAAKKQPIRFASKEESRPDAPPATTEAAPAAAGTEASEEGDQPMAFHDDLRQRLGLPDDAAEADITAALDKALKPKAEAPALPEGTVAIDKTQLEELRVSAAAGVRAEAEQKRQHREALVGAAVAAGKIPPARREAWVKQLEVDAGAADVLASLEPGLIPMAAVGHAGDVELSTEDDRILAALGIPTGKAA